MHLPHLPALRRGQPYESLDTVEVVDYRTRAPLARVSQVNAGIIRKDLGRLSEGREALRKFTVEQLLGICTRAAELFLKEALPLGDKGHTQSADEYVQTLSATSGLPFVMVRRNMQKIHQALTSMRTVLNGLTRNLPLEIIDARVGEDRGGRLSYYPTTAALGLIMPSNSPAVNSLWLPAIPLKTPVIIKPGREEPWTPYRLIQAFIAAGAPASAFGFYPTDHEGGAEIMKLAGRALIFGDASTVAQYRDNPKFSIHGPGWSKILFGEDQVDHWQDHLDLLVASISDNGGRSCINASAIVVPRHGRALAEALAQRLGPIVPVPATDESARLSGFANPKMAEFIDTSITEGLATPGATDLTAAVRLGSPRKVEFDGGVYLRPTIVHCDNFQHPLANKEFLCPYASVVEVPQADMLSQIGSSLVVTAITRDQPFIDQLLDSPLIERLNIGPVPTTRISWDQPHEGNMFEFLYHRRSIENGW